MIPIQRLTFIVLILAPTEKFTGCFGKAESLLKIQKPLIKFSNSSIDASSGEVILNAGTYGYERPLRQGDSLNVTCYSNLPVQWVVVQGEETFGPDFSQSFDFTEMIVTNQTNFGGYRHSVNLYIGNIKYDDTGLYVCILLHDSKMNASVYIFAKDLERPFTDRNYVNLPSYPNHLTLYKFKGFTVPCQTSFPKINVTFRREFSKPFGPEQGVVFDPKWGVKIKQIDESFDGSFVCETELNGKVYRRTFLFNVLVQYMRLQPNSDVHIIIGDSFSISCFVISSVWIPLVTWYNSSNEIQENTRISIRETYEIAMTDVHEVRSDLTVKDASPFDEGIYKCAAWENSENGNVEINIFVHEGTFVNLEAEEENVIVRENADEEAEFNIRVQSYPKPEFYWIREGKIIQKNETKIFSNAVSNDEILLRVNYPDRHDTGVYTLFAFVKDMNASLDVRLFVEYLPSAKITSNNGGSEFFFLETEYRIMCSVESFPLIKNIDWFEQTCESPANCSIQDDKWVPVKFASGSDTSSGPFYPKLIHLNASYELAVSKIIVKDSNAGNYKVYKCQGQNKVGLGSATLPYVPTDVKNGFKAWTLDSYPYAGDTVKLYFKASVWKYSDMSVMNMSQATQIDPGWDSERTNITYVSETQWKQIIVTVSPVSRYDRKFVCFGYDGNGKKIDGVIGKIRLYVRDTVRPFFSTEDAELFFEDRSFAYNCEVEGQPTPEIYWYKDSRKLSTNNSMEDFRITDNGHRLRIHATDSSFDGSYSCVAENRGGSVSRNFTFSYESTVKEKLHQPLKPTSISWTTIAIIISCAIVATVLIILMCLFWSKRKRQPLKLPNNLEQFLLSKRTRTTDGNLYTSC